MTVCAIAGCGRDRTGRSRYCGTHVARIRRHGDPDANFRRVRPECSVDACSKPHSSKGFCRMHLARFERHGDPLAKFSHKNEGRQVCQVDDCQALVKAYGWCDKHWARVKRWGDPLALQRTCIQCGVVFHTETSASLCSNACRKVSLNAPEKRLTKRAYWHRYYALKVGSSVGPVDYRAVLERCGWVCQICMEPIDPGLKHPDPRSASIDHITPLSKGGPHVDENLQAAHYGCNSRKGNRWSAPVDILAPRRDGCHDRKTWSEARSAGGRK